MNNNYYQSPKSSWLMKMFWKAAGADQYLLERSTYSDQIKYFCLGGIVVATGVMAALAGGYAFYTIFSTKDRVTGDMIFSISDAIISSVFGIVWGLIIFNIDRFIVASTGKGDGTEAITKDEFFSAIPRIVMGLIIALTISKPIEIRMFQREIQTQLTQKKEYEKGINKKNIENRFKSSLEKKDLEIKEINSRIDEANRNYQLKFQMWSKKTQECKCTAPIHKAESDIAYTEWQSLKENSQIDINRLQKERNDIIEQKKIELKNLDLNIEGLNGLGVRIRLISHPKVAGPWISLFITLLFMVIELTPIFFKMMLIKGPYDYMDDNIKDLARAESGIEVEYNFYRDKKGMEAHKVTNHAAELKNKEKLLIIKAQEELNEKIILNWKNEKLKDIDDNPDKYISEK
jgi:hypothetical protein